MYRLASALALLLTTLALAGCIGGDDGQAPGGPGASPTPQPTGTPTTTLSPGQPPPTAGDSDPTRPDAQPWQWPPLSDATIRPGVQMIADGAQCTSNFLFLDPLNTTVYLGFAAHCVAAGPATNSNGCDGAVNTPLALGSPVEVQGASRPATLVYSSWATMQAVNETADEPCTLNDFAVVQLHPDDFAKAHPAMLTFGGPTGYAGGVGLGDKVLTFGNTGLRLGPSELDAREGYVLFSSEWSSTVYTVTPGLPGDSGSGVLTGEGAALGVLVTVGLLPFTASNGVTTLAPAVAYAWEHAGLALHLATWDVLDSGTLP